MSYNFELYHGNIVDLQNKVDVIVNAAKPSLEGGSGVDGAIHKAAGPQLLVECQKISSNPNRCNPGEIVATDSYKMSCKRIYHTVGVKLENANKYTQLDVRLLKKCYRSSIKKCINEGFKSIAFPVIGSGSYKWDKRIALMVAVTEIHNMLIEIESDIMIYLVIFDDPNYFKLANKLLDKHKYMYSKNQRSIALNAYQSQKAYIRDILKTKNFSLLFIVRLILVLYPYLYPITLFFRNIAGKISWNHRRVYIEMVVVIKLLIMVFFVLTPFICHSNLIIYYIQPIIVVYLMLESILYASSLLFLKDVQNPSASNDRSILLALINLAEIQFGFAFLYKIFDVIKEATSSLDYIYYSFTHSGDIEKSGYIIEIIQICVNFYMISILLSLFLAGLKPREYILEKNE